MTFDEKTMAALKPYEKNLMTATFEDWARLVGNTEFNVIHDIYLQINRGMDDIQRGCGRCVLRMLKTVGRIYFQTKDQQTDKPTKTRTKKAKV